ncbi:hypothetical protein C9I57_20750 [Trinickia symbiotica]|uniref:ATP synthase subunit I n=1 Tax=Trinickia symbiotica TaxID=863227 RepID=A0A2T3XR47_9BURK|nr:hypothetical protein [Trinickia symbiotica]PTB18922.1 hypothetical protein C9I57_20750 [Trinickia symbiotica]
MTSISGVGWLHAASSLFAGLLVGGGHFLLLRFNGSLFGRGCMRWALALQVARVAATSAALFALARFGAFPLLAGLTGILLARRAVLRATLRFSDPRT